ncbi:50S ribosomal protein L15 [Fusobacterium sp. MFO224]|uniref:50S ribosomal protein L15 n=1 Tax=Fusobacterium sp. MFO224 TaxID=3378070 RepID=UPI003854FFC8
MKLNELQPSVPRKNRKRVGRGESSGWGKTSGRGSNGQKSRSGGGTRPGFEGGQMPIIQRAPKRGFSNYPFKKEYAIINLDTLNRFEEGTVVTPEILFETGLVKKMLDGVKVLGNGTLDKKVSVRAHKVSKSAQKAIEAVNGVVEIIEVKTFADVAKNNK